MIQVNDKVQAVTEALALIESGQVEPHEGIFIDWRPSPTGTCHACACGTLLASMTGKRYLSDIEGERGEKGDARRMLQDLFSPEQCASIEAAFEGEDVVIQESTLFATEWVQAWGEDVGRDDTVDTDCGCYSLDVVGVRWAALAPAFDFGGQFDDPKDRLVRILENMLANNGEFRP